MASRLARALMEDPSGKEGSPRRTSEASVERVLSTTFWRTTTQARGQTDSAKVISMIGRTPAARIPDPRD